MSFGENKSAVAIALALAVVAATSAGCSRSGGHTTAARPAPQSGLSAEPLRYHHRPQAARAQTPVGKNWTLPWRTRHHLPSYVKVGRPYTIAGRTYTPRHDPDYDRTGLASWYGPGMEGRSTANGERLDPGALTAAHPTLPMPSLVRVTNLENGRQVVVRVNDRGPFIEGRIIDLTPRGADALGFTKNGRARVRVQYMSLARPGSG